MTEREAATHGADANATPHPPPTRFQGSKLKLLDWLGSQLLPLPFTTCLDAFGGSASVSHYLKAHGKAVTFNDALACCCVNGIALVENDSATLSDAEAAAMLQRHPGRRYDNLIERTFEGIYYTAQENRWLDVLVQNIGGIPDRRRRALALYALFQSSMAKRPYNLFHRKNLYMRLANVSRSFGNKTTWDRPFGEHFLENIRRANAAVFQGKQRCKAINVDARAAPGEFDLVYIDPPYINGRGVAVDYRGFYHFLEGMCDYANWEAKIDFASRHRRLRAIHSPWQNAATIAGALAELFDRFRRGILAVSYRSDGIPSPRELARLMAMHKRRVTLHQLDRTYQYALSTNVRSTEILVIGQ